ncbi:MAG: HNH endonuclease [Chloroflexi bacterium]|nr:HNH endonuclease [Chloroflexota bacterium]
MVVDHVIPVSAGGETDAENLCYSCVSCNSYKLNFQTGLDPELKRDARLFDPRSDCWTEHFRWSDDSCEIIGLTSIGRATVNRLRMNQPLMLIARREWKKTGSHPPMGSVSGSTSIE